MATELASQADVSWQDELWIGRQTGGTGPFTYTQVFGVETVGMPEKTPDDIDVTHQQSPGRSRETIPGLLSAAEFSQELQFWPAHSSQIALDALASLSEAGTPEDIHVVMVVGGLQRAYRAHVTSFTPSGTVGDKRMSTCAFKVFERITTAPTLPAP